MRRTRFVAFAAWLGVSLLTIAGFAVFSPDPDLSSAPPTTSEPSQATQGRGRIAGRLAASAFAVAVTPPPTTAPPEVVATEAATEPPPTTEPPGPVATTTTQPPPPDTTTPSPDTTAAPESTGPLSENEVRSIVARYFRPEDVETAVEIARCESNFDPAAYNPVSGASGLFQHLAAGWEERAAAAGFPGASPFNPTANTAAAAWLVYEGGGWWHWDGSCAVSG